MFYLTNIQKIIEMGNKLSDFKRLKPKIIV